MIRVGRPGPRHAVQGAVAATLIAISFAAGTAVTSDAAPSPAAGGVAVPSAVDIGFCQDMIVHHEQAVLMAQLARGESADARVAALAASIEADQLLDLGAMRAYLALWRAPVLPSGPPMTWMDLPHTEQPAHSAPTAMPGLATIAELNRLRSAEGRSRDTLFLRLMLRHHEGGLSMLHDAAARAAIAAVRELASRLAFHQGEEIATIMSLVADRDASPSTSRS